MPHNHELTKLLQRLPELAWQLDKIARPTLPKLLPAGLFKCSIDVSSNSYIDEIKHDILRLKTSESTQSSHYLASKIQQKINVLVAICDGKNQDIKKNKANDFSLQSISTRQQWLQSLQQSIKNLTLQKTALMQTLAQKDSTQKIQLSLYRELGELEKRLTLAEETYQKNINS